MLPAHAADMQQSIATTRATLRNQLAVADMTDIQTCNFRPVPNAHDRVGENFVNAEVQ
jgi:hypothetical protein